MMILDNININIMMILIFLSIIFYIYHKSKYRNDVFKRFSETLAIFEKSKELAYNKIFYSDIIVQSASGYKINKDETDKFQSKYIKLVFLFSGNSIINDLKILYGDMESICSSLANEFIHRVNQDESEILNKVSEISNEESEREIE